MIFINHKLTPKDMIKKYYERAKRLHGGRNFSANYNY